LKSTGAWLAVLIFCTAAHAAAAPRIAFVQEIAAPGGDGLVTGLRLGFAKSGDGWTPICADSCRFDARRPTQWHVRYRGGDLGVVTAGGWSDAGTIAMAGLLKIVSADPPHQGTRTKIFAGWSDRAVHRPLVATSETGAEQASRWRQSDPQDSDAARMLPLLAHLVPKIPRCVGGEAQGDGRALTASDIRIAEVWRNATGARLLSASVKPERVKACDYTADTLADVWAFDDGKSLLALPALAAPETTHAFLDAGDFVGDGREEVVFWLSGYNEDGFVLYYDNFTRAAETHWNYQ
jgi:hypothetical protein